MIDSLLNLVLGLLASAISAGLGWLAQTVRRRRRLGRVREFFGMPGGTECLLVVNRQSPAASSKSVSRNDVYALMELAALVKECGAQADIVAHDQVRQGLGGKAEFCLGGPDSNERTAAHLRNWLPGAGFVTEPGRTYSDTIMAGDELFRHEHDDEIPKAYVLLARVHAAEGSRPVFLIAGQTATSNHAAVRYLTANHRQLARRYGRDGAFALVLRVINPHVYGPDVVELASDVTAKAFATAG
ncbi:hypothetical protein F4556_004414 [Kitasatospora gansuensis]|uniref:Secreted protein n=1 Tax=Kitasatospora gansuensis TaxID=258050 RepID=A0A7W7SE98_9ACTN|nr:hypothetical protein [Kitasatospora gansuensis]MBB4948879.1 hypothetical protein [Kitasatospora gansuensis]